jgi:exodeoxyribonuclease VII large subunit
MPSPEPPADRVASVTEVTDHIKRLLDDDAALADVWVRGEVRDFRAAASGHWYFALKDASAVLKCVMWRNRAAAQAQCPEDGASVVVHGSVSVYAAQGQYQLYADHLEPAGRGELFLAFERLKARLQAEGLFDPGRKRPLPQFPRRVGVVTSADAAALRDVCQVLARRWPLVEVLVAPTLVQGQGAPALIAAAVGAAGKADVDAVLVVRGGGSVEDLWAFNDEGVARAIAACPAPVVTGVGHETDVTIADFVADVRAPTPSAAAEIVTPDGRELMITVDGLRDRLTEAAAGDLRARSGRVDDVRRRLSLVAPARWVDSRRELLAERRVRLDRAIGGSVQFAQASVDALARRLTALDPSATLARGYAHVTRAEDGRTVSSVGDVAPGMLLCVRVTDGDFDALAAERRPRAQTREER